MTLSCREAIRLISEGMDHPLPLWQWIGLRVHLFACLWCERYKRQLLFIRNALRQRPDGLVGDEPSAGLPPQARERLTQALRQKQSPKS